MNSELQVRNPGPGAGHVLFVDDTKEYEFVLHWMKKSGMQIPPAHVHSEARNYEDAKCCLKDFHWDILLLDHDLGGEKTGYDLLKWLQSAYPKITIPRKIYLISNNTVGVRNMMALLRDFKSAKVIDEYAALSMMSL